MSKMSELYVVINDPCLNFGSLYEIPVHGYFPLDSII